MKKARSQDDLRRNDGGGSHRGRDGGGGHYPVPGYGGGGGGHYPVTGYGGGGGSGGNYGYDRGADRMMYGGMHGMPSSDQEERHLAMWLKM